MNNNKYYEFNLQPKNEAKERLFMNLFKIIKIALFILSGIFAIIALIYSDIMWLLAFITITTGFVALFFQYKFYNFYDFIFIDGFVSITKVINNQRRKQIKRFPVKTINKIGFAGGETYNLYYKDRSIKKLIITKVITDKDVCILFGEEDKFLLVMPFDDKLLSCIMRYIGSGKFERGFLTSVSSL
ncbi:MAG: hypothetical protein IJA97_06310 [Clostridia bacterium]|nr:hypothetical protein [Clostridia bacterium]